MLLKMLLLTPLLGIFLITISRYFALKFEKIIALITTIINLLVSLVIFILFDFSINEFAFVQEYHNLSSYDLYLGIDGISIYFVVRRLINVKPTPLRVITRSTLCKPTDLPEMETRRGPEHVSKALKRTNCKFLESKVMSIQGISVVLSQDYILVSKASGTKCDNNFIKKRSMKLDLLSSIWRTSLKHTPKNRLTDFVLRTRDLLSLGINIHILRLWTPKGGETE